MSRYTITPWRTQADLIRVRQQLFESKHDNTDLRRQAVDRIMAWKLRGNLPHAVESTALLIDAILHHNIKSNSTFSIRAVYSAAFSRFVTGFCDIGRHRERTLEPSSMLEVARQIDMPVEFVALRHEATHEELPGIQRLVSATELALNWLWKVYWNRLEEPENVEAVRSALPAMKSDVSAIVRDFRRSRRDAFRHKAQRPLEQSEDVLRTAVACIEICGQSQLSTEALANVLVEERLLLPSSRELGSPLDGAYLIWDDLLREVSLRLSAFLPALFRALLEALSKASATDPEGDVDKEAFNMWLLHVLREDPYTTGSKSKHVLFVGAMKWCCLHPGYWTERLGHDLMRSDEALRADWEDLFEASQLKTGANSLSDAPRENNPIRHVDELDTVGRNVSGEGSRSSRRGWVRAAAPTSAPVGVVH